MPVGYFVSVLAHDARYCELQILYAQSRYRSEQKSIKNVGKISCGRSHAVTPKNFQSTHIHYRAHRAVIFAIARLSCYFRYLQHWQSHEWLKADLSNRTWHLI